MSFAIRTATAEDIPALTALLDASVRGLQHSEYTPDEIEGALRTIYGVDTQLIADGTYFAVESETGQELIACGGWSKRKTLFGGDQCVGREDALLNPATDAAKIRAFFVLPRWARRGLGSRILQACETAAVQAGFTRFEMGATLTGVKLYQARGYAESEHVQVPLANGAMLHIVRMNKTIARPEPHSSNR